MCLAQSRNNAQSEQDQAWYCPETGGWAGGHLWPLSALSFYKELQKVKAVEKHGWSAGTQRGCILRTPPQVGKGHSSLQDTPGR